jgi:hypothetical protein
MEAVDFINKKNVASLEVRENTGEITRLLDLRARGCV